MSLPVRLNLLIAVCFTLVLLAGIFMVINHARHAVKDEVSSTANLTLQLIEIAVSNARIDEQYMPGLQHNVVQQLANLQEARHLYIGIYQNGVPVVDTSRAEPDPPTTEAPGWFMALVGPTTLEFRRVLDAGIMPQTEIVLRADPADEVAEAWREARVVLGLLILFVVVANILIYLTIHRGLRPIDSILSALDGIEQGDYELRLPHFDLPELDRISMKFNHMAEVLQRSQEENHALTQRSLAIQERERRNLAHELHDELGQSISAIKAVAVSISHQTPAGHDDIETSSKTIVEISNRMHDVARQMMRRLRPVVLDELGLLAALQEMVDDWNSRNDEMFCHFSHRGDFRGLGEGLNISVYRMIQESLTNIVRHADAENVDIKIERAVSNEQDNLSLHIRDDGLGFDPDKARWGLGLLGMRERTESVGGKFSLAAVPGEGVSININIPLKKTENLQDAK
ncbi:MAG: ATP-binding protein [Gammaproteobacteria bacterium]